MFVITILKIRWNNKLVFWFLITIRFEMFVPIITDGYYSSILPLLLAIYYPCRSNRFKIQDLIRCVVC
jgi:hypothetical protein